MSVARFFIVQMLILVVVAGAMAYRVEQLDRLQRLPELRQTPIQIGPQFDYDLVVTDDQLDRVLGRLVLPDDAADTKVNHVDHALRLWGVESRFNQAGTISGEAMRQLLVDHRLFAARYGQDVPPLLMAGDVGPRVRVQEGIASSSHVDHTLASLAEVGTPLDYPLQTDTGPTTYGAMLRESLRSFRPNQVEYEWSALAYALFLPPSRAWVTSEGQHVDFDDLARRLMRQEMPQGVCFGNHRLYTLVVFLRVDDRFPMLTAEVRQTVIEYLQSMTAALVRNQHPMGFWNQNWPNAKPAQVEPSGDEGDRILDRLLATGHALEWWAMAPKELHPPRHVLASAGQWLVRTVDALTEDEIRANFTYLSHVGRALSLWRGRLPGSELRAAIPRQPRGLDSP